MKVKITALKAPWPEGAQVGQIVQFKGESIPAWAAGKCIRVDGEKTDHVYEPPPPPRAEAATTAGAAFSDGQALQAARAEVAELQAKLAERETEDGKATASLKAADEQAVGEKARGKTGKA